MTRQPRERTARSAEPPHYGWPGLGGGRSRFVRAPLEFRGSTTQVCGLWPFATGTATPMVGVPLGRSLINDATVCCDPLSWFQEARLIHNPSASSSASRGSARAR